MAALVVAVGGGLGAVLRFLLDSWVTRSLSRSQRGDSHVRGGQRFPWGITVVNLTGSLTLGVLVGWLGRDLADSAAAHSAGPAALLWLTLGVGLLGGFTTMSTASLDTVRLAQSGRIAAAAGNALGTLGAGALLAAAGILIGQAIS
ncbi:fluoride efflux transporter FluC [Leucobacter aridicollis]|uniref:fluoride efflux transporter FluC n=1 Tax=Leucobacter aridicollis TaxID=283878 RepID=UPI000E64AF2F|nr:CrcB family protein [Leucobacter aridicollis]UTX54475.1 CrcB family protein [Leucobacter aridicollis]